MPPSVAVRSVTSMGFAIASALGAILVLLIARRFRGGMFARFVAVLMTVHTLSSIGLFVGLREFWPAFYYLQLVTFIHFAMLVRPKMRPAWWRVLISVPGHFFVGATVLGIPFAIAGALGVRSWWLLTPFVLGLIGVIQAFSRRQTEVHVDLVEDRDVDGLQRHRLHNPKTKRTLRIVQITDPHLGPWMSVGQLKKICERAVARQPDLIVLTGDFLTMESHDARDGLAEALSPLSVLPGRVFACLGNHDYEALENVQSALRLAGAKLLVDEEAIVDTAAGPVQVVGLDFVWREREQHMSRALSAMPRRPDALRLLLLHDPGAFRHVPEGDADLVLSGHTHGGQLGLVSLGLPWTALSFAPTLPDHGLWALGRNRLYVHRGTGHYGFPLRLGVPREESVIVAHLGDVAGQPQPDMS